MTEWRPIDEFIPERHLVVAAVGTEVTILDSPPFWLKLDDGSTVLAEMRSANIVGRPHQGPVWWNPAEEAPVEGTITKWRPLTAEELPEWGMEE